MTDTAAEHDPTSDATSDPTTQWHRTACILCSINCGIEVRLDGRRRSPGSGATRPTSSRKGYTCEKALRLDHYQNGRTG